MAERYIHVEIDNHQTSKYPGDTCGDVVEYERTSSDCTIVVSDGLGHGIKANIAAQMCVSRIMQLLRQGVSLRKAFSSIAATMEQSKGTDLPYAVFTVMRILNDGMTTVLSYEMPPPIFVTRRYAQVLAQRTITQGHWLIEEANCHLATDEGILIVTDGITQAGLGRELADGWTAEGASEYINDCLSDGAFLKSIPGCVLSRARELWTGSTENAEKAQHHERRRRLKRDATAPFDAVQARFARKRGTGLGDDCTAVLASCRWGRTVNILTGPPGDRKKDRELVQRFMMMNGTKVVCGGTTAQIVAKTLGKPLLMEQNPQSMLAPPRHIIEGVDLVTEGAITLNQVYNVLDEAPDVFDEESGVTQLHKLLHDADRVNILIGGAINPATADISFRQKGILTRHKIIPLIAKKLEDAGKLVVIEHLVRQ